MPVQYAEATGEAIDPKEKGQWLSERAPSEKQSILGKGRSALLASGAVTLKQVYARAGSPLSYAKPLRDIAGTLLKAPKAKLVRAAIEHGFNPKGMSRAEIIDNIAGRRIVGETPVKQT